MSHRSEDRLVRLSIVLFLSIFLPLSGAARAQVITEYTIPTSDSRPGSIAAGPDGALWFTENGASKIGRISTTGTITEFSVPLRPNGVAAGSDGALWFTAAQSIGRVSLDGTVTMFPVSELDTFYAIASGSDGNIWFTTVGKVGRITPDGSARLFSPPIRGNGAPVGIANGPDGNLWYTTGLGNSVGRIGTSGSATEFLVPPPPSEPAGITAGPDGSMWFTAQSGYSDAIYRMGLSGLETRPFGIPTTDAMPVGIASGPDGNLWFTELSGNNIGRITPEGAVTEYPIPTPASAPRGIAAGSDGAPWFVEEAGNKIGRVAIGASGTCTPDTHTLCLVGGRFSVKASFQPTPTGPSFEAHAVPFTDHSGYFWFFDASNVEIVVKVLNACVDPFDSYWVFAAGLTNVAVVMTVTDTLTGATRQYENALGTPFAPIQDTKAFSTCP